MQRRQQWIGKRRVAECFPGVLREGRLGIKGFEMTVAAGEEEPLGADLPR